MLNTIVKLKYGQRVVYVSNDISLHVGVGIASSRGGWWTEEVA